MKNNEQIHVISLFSGGLDSILASLHMQKLGVKVSCLHFISPFFGKKEMIQRWQEDYNLEIRPVDISKDYISMLMNRPKFGFGKIMNPCIDCKVLMLRHAKKIMQELGAHGIISGEVVGQRPMSQRSEALNIILNEAGVKGILLRPLCAKHLEPTDLEVQGLIDREKLLNISGRARKDQLALAEEFGLSNIPSPAGACLLGEADKARNYWKIIENFPQPTAGDFKLTDAGRQFWADTGQWLIIGRNQEANDYLHNNASPKDYLIKVDEYPGPMAFGRHLGEDWPEELLVEAGSLCASYSSRAREASEDGTKPVEVRIYQGNMTGKSEAIFIIPHREPKLFAEAQWEDAKEQIKEEARRRQDAVK